jgi:hypothetical protein
MTSDNKSAIQNKFLRTVATILSYLLHPVFIPLYLALFLHWFAPQTVLGGKQSFNENIAVIIENTVLFPLLVVALLRGLGFLKSFTMQNPKDRIVPLMGTMIFYFWAYWVLRNTDAPFILRVLLLGSFWGVIAVFMINIFYKISMHTSGAGSMVGLFIVLMLTVQGNFILPFMAVLAIAALIGYIRVISGTHKMFEIWMGYITGLLIMLAAYLYLK